jgi:hypothetical protein
MGMKRRTQVFFRDDDVGANSESLHAVVELLIAEGVPCNYQIVPALLERETADYLREHRARHPDLVALNQHGHRHKRVSSIDNWAEFGGGSSYTDQHAEIAAGRQILAAALEGDFGSDVFTPPCHKFDAATLRALRDVGVRVLSAGVRTRGVVRLHYALGRALGSAFLFGVKVSHHGRPLPGTGLVELSAAIDVDEDLDRNEVPIEKSVDCLTREFERARAQYPIVGVMLHHARYTQTRKLDTLRQFVLKLKADSSLEFRTLESLAAAIPASAGRCVRE